MFLESDELRELLYSDASSFGIELTDNQAYLLLKYIDLVVEKNKVINLTRITDPISAIRLHLIDSLLLAAAVSSKCKFIDIGTGAGMPGIPFAIATGSNGYLLDSVGKKIIAVNEFINELGLQKSLLGVNSRAEEFVLKNHHTLDLVMARAVAPLCTLVEYASPFLHTDGLFLAAKSRITDEELSDGLKAACIVGLSMVSRETFELPDNAGHREILVFQKNGKEKVRLPRKNGMAKNHPLI